MYLYELSAMVVPISGYNADRRSNVLDRKKERQRGEGCFDFRVACALARCEARKSGNSFGIGSPSLIRTQRKETTLLFFELNEGAPPVRVMVTVCPPLG